MKQVNKEICDMFGCWGKPTTRVMAWIHPVTNGLIYRDYCFAHTPVNCPICRFSIGIIFKGIDKRRKKRTYKCLECEGKVFELDLF